MNNYLRIGLIFGIFLTPFIAFLVPQSMFFPFISGKNFAFRVLVEVILGLYTVLAIRVPEYRPRFSWILGAFLIFITIIGLADFLGENPFKSLWSNYERMEGYISFLHFFVFMIIVGAVLNTEKLWERLLQTSLGASVLMGFYAVLQVAGIFQIHQGSTRVDGTLGNSTYLAIYIVLHIFIAIFLLLRHREVLFVRILYGITVLLNLFVLYKTETRGAILGFLGGAFLTALIIGIFERDNKRLKKWALGGVLGILVTVGLFVAMRDTQFVQSQATLSRLASISLTDAKTNPRIPIWELALEGFKERPILGWGQENFNYVFNKYYDPVLYPQEQWFDRTHNVVLDWLIAGGILGLFGYLSLYLIALLYLWKKGEFTFTERAVFTGLLAAYFFHNLFVFDNLISLIIFVTLLAYLHAHVTRQKLPLFGGEASQWLKTAGAPAALIVTVILMYAINWNAYLANTTLIKAITTSSKPEESIPLFKKALAYDAFGNQEIREQLMQYAINLRNAQVPDSVKQEVFTLTQVEMEKMIAQAPNDTRHHLFYGSVLDAYGQFDAAEKELLEALRTSSKKQTIFFQLGTHYLNAGNTQKALEAFKTAYDLAPEYREARIIYAMGAIYAGNIALSDQILGGEQVADDRLLRAYVAIRRFDRAITMVQAKVAENPSDINTRMVLASVYYQAGQKANAIATIRAIIADNPQFKDQGETYIKEIENN